MTEITTILQNAIKPTGFISFARFMELSLYCPKIGYYERTGEMIGRAGDFFTSVSIGPLFGQLLAFQFAEWLASSSAHPVQIVEAGAHDGRLAGDILGWLRENRPGLLKGLEYWIIEPSTARRDWQRQRLEEFSGRVTWFADLAQLPPGGVNGVVFANELLDAFPVRRFGWEAAGRRWFEWGVAVKGEHFVWQKMPEAPESIMADLAQAGLVPPPELLAVLPDGCIWELCPAAGSWWQQAAHSLRHGKLLTLDYGLTAEQFLAPEHCQGTLRAYRQHRASAEVLAHPGEQDLTAHVNFTRLQRAGEAAGLQTETLSSQAQFLTTVAQRAWDNLSSFGEWTPNRSRQFQTLTHPEHLGRTFRVLVQSR